MYVIYRGAAIAPIPACRRKTHLGWSGRRVLPHGGRKAVGSQQRPLERPGGGKPKAGYRGKWANRPAGGRYQENIKPSPSAFLLPPLFRRRRRGPGSRGSAGHPRRWAGGAAFSAGCHSGVGKGKKKQEGKKKKQALKRRGDGEKTTKKPPSPQPQPRHAAVRAAAAPLLAGRGGPGPPVGSRSGPASDRVVPVAPRAQPLRGKVPGPGGPCEKDAGERLQGGEGGRAGEEERRAPAALEEEALHPHRGGAAPRPPQAAPAAAGAAGRAGGQDEGASLLQHEDGGLRGAQRQVRVLHGGDGRGQGDRLSVRSGAGLERGDHAADGAVQEPPGHPGRPLHPAEAAAPGAAPRPPPPQRLQLRLGQVKLRKRFGEAGLSAFVADVLELVKNWANAGDGGRLERSGSTT